MAPGAGGRQIRRESEKKSGVLVCNIEIPMYDLGMQEV